MKSFSTPADEPLNERFRKYFASTTLYRTFRLLRVLSLLDLLSCAVGHIHDDDTGDDHQKPDDIDRRQCFTAQEYADESGSGCAEAGPHAVGETQRNGL